MAVSITHTFVSPVTDELEADIVGPDEWNAAHTISGGEALTKSDDTNVTLTLGGTPTTALLNATSVTVGWTGALAMGRGGFGADISAISGIPRFAAGSIQWHSRTGTGDVVFSTSPTLVTPDIGTATATAIELGATDTTLTRASAGVLAVEGVNVLTTASGQPLDATLTALAAYNTNGLLTQTAADTFTGRTLTGPAAGISVSNGSGVSGNPTLALANDLSALEGLSSTGIAARTATDTWAQRTITGTSNQISVSNGDGVSGNPTLSLPSDVVIPTVITAPNSGLHILDTDASHDLIITPGSNLTADRVLTVTTGDAARTLTISGDATVSQDYSTSGNPQFATIELGAASDTTLARSSAGNVTIEGNLIYRAGGTDVAVADGGTNLSSYTAGDTLYASGTTTLAKLGIGTSGYLLGSTGSAPAWVGFTQAGTGATSNRTWQTKLREVFSAADFGVVYDGVTVTTTALQAAIDAANAAGGGDVLLDRGTCLVNAIALKTGVRLVGQGMGNTTLKFNATSGGVVLLRTTNNGSVTRYGAANLTLDANSLTNGIAFAYDGSFGVLDHVEIKNSGSGSRAGVIFNHGTNHALRDCYVHDNTYGCFGGQTAVTLEHIDISGCLFDNNDVHGLEFGSTSDATMIVKNLYVDNCIVSNNGDTGAGGGIWVNDSGSHITIANSVIHDNEGDNLGLSGTYVTATGVDSYNALVSTFDSTPNSACTIINGDHIAVTGCNFSYASGDNIIVAGSTNVTIAGCNIFNGSTQTIGAGSGINIARPGGTEVSTNVNICGNNIYDTLGTPRQAYGVDIGTAQVRIYVSNNVITGNATASIRDNTGGSNTSLLNNAGGTNSSISFPTVTATTSFVCDSTTINSSGYTSSDPVTCGDQLSTGSGVSTAASYINIGGARSGSGQVYVDFYSEASTIGARMIRQSGANGGMEFAMNGTGAMTFRSNDVANIAFITHANNLLTLYADGGALVGASGSDPGSNNLAVQGTITSNSINVLSETFVIPVGDETTAITTGTAKVTFRMPYAFTVTAVRASLTTASSSGNPTVDINESGTTILSTKLSIDSGEKTSTTAATAAVISDTALADDAEITIDIDTAGTGAAGLKVYIIGRR